MRQLTFGLHDLRHTSPENATLCRAAVTHLRQHPDDSLTLYRHDTVETLILGTRAGQAEDGSPVVDWGDYDAVAETLRRDSDGVLLDLRGNVLNGRHAEEIASY